MAKKDDNKLCARGKRAAKAKYDTYPSAYANGYAVQVCKGTKPDASGNKKKASGYRKGGYVARAGEFSKGGLAEWFGKNDGKGWARCNKSGKTTEFKPCGRKDADSGGSYPACRPTVSECNKSKPKTKKDSSKRVDWEKKKK
jgi:hypothetical protein